MSIRKAGSKVNPKTEYINGESFVRKDSVYLLYPMLNTKGLKVGIFPSQTLKFILYTVICGLPLMLVAKVLCGDSVYLLLLMLNTKGLEVRIFPS